MDTQKRTVRDLLEESKKRIVFLIICVIGLSYLMSLTSSSVWINLPAATSFVLFLRYISVDLEMRRKTAIYSKTFKAGSHNSKRFVELREYSSEKSKWREKVNSPIVEAAIDQFSRRLISEWVTNLWYSRLTPDKEGPEELVRIMNSVLGEISLRIREINLIDLLTRDLIAIFCNNLELYRSIQSKIGKDELDKLSSDSRNTCLKQMLTAENKLHPALFSVETEHKVLDQLMEGLISVAFNPADLQCTFFRYLARELLACAVMRPLLNLASPRFINERIESLVLTSNHKANKTSPLEGSSQGHPISSSKTSPDLFSSFLDHSSPGVELVQLKHHHSDISDGGTSTIVNGKLHHLEMSNHSSSNSKIHDLPSTKSNLSPEEANILHSREFFPHESQVIKESVQTQKSEEWGQMLDMISRRKVQVLAPEHFENMWTKGRNYKKQEVASHLEKEVVKNSLSRISCNSEELKMSARKKMQHKSGIPVIFERKTNLPCENNQLLSDNAQENSFHSESTLPHFSIHKEEVECHELASDIDTKSVSSCATEDDESSSVTGLDTPGTKVWDSKNNRSNSISNIRHPLENSESHPTPDNGERLGDYQRPSKNQTRRKRSRSSDPNVSIWHEMERSTFLSGDGQDLLHSLNRNAKSEDSGDDAEVETWGRIHSGVDVSSSPLSTSTSEAHLLSHKLPYHSILSDSFLKLKCQVIGANIVRSGPTMFAVYSISVSDAYNNSWSIKRRFRHFEELHRRLKEFPEYTFSLPPKHFLSSGLDISVIRERCKLLDKYLKKLLQLPNISGSIDIWDFLSVDSQTYLFSDSLSIIRTVPVDFDDKGSEKHGKCHGSVNHSLLSNREKLVYGNQSSHIQIRKKHSPERSSLNNRAMEKEGIFKEQVNDDLHKSLHNSTCSPKYENIDIENEKSVSSVPSGLSQELDDDPALPAEWVPPNLSLPLLDLVDVIFQLNDGGWIRRKTFWIAKQVLQLGMGDAFDDWLIEKIQLLRKGSVVASMINQLEQILWPDGIFITKHPKHQRPSPSSNQLQALRSCNLRTEDIMPAQRDSEKHDVNDVTLSSHEQQELQASQRAKFVHELIIENAPSALVGLFGHKEYTRCAEDVYLFLQSSVCLKQLAYDLLEFLLLSAFPELGDVIKVFHEEKERLGQVESNKKQT